MNMFEELNKIMGVGNDTTIVIRKLAEDKMTVSVNFRNNAVKDEAKDLLQPFIVSGTPAELDGGFVAEISKPIAESAGLQTSMQEFEAAKKRYDHSAPIDFAGANPEAGSYVSARFLPELSWFLIVEHPTGNFFNSLRRSAVKTALVFVAVLLMALCVTARVVHSFEREINRMADERQRNLAAMRDAMILTLADMVEGRDQNTGQHIRKTAAYVRIIMEELQRE